MPIYPYLHASSSKKVDNIWSYNDALIAYKWNTFKGENEIEGLTDKVVPRRLGPKRATRIRRLFNLSKEDDVRKYVIRRTLPEKEGRTNLIIYHIIVINRSMYEK